MLDKFERRPQTFDGPTPIEKLERLAAHRDGAPVVSGYACTCRNG